MPVVRFTIPADAGQEVDRLFRSLLGLGLRPWPIGHVLQLRQLYGLPVKPIRPYARQLGAARALLAVGAEARTLAQANVLTRMPSSTQRRLDTLFCDLAVSVRTRLSQADLPPERAVGLLNVLARHQQALTHQQARKIQAHKYAQEAPT